MISQDEKEEIRKRYHNCISNILPGFKYQGEIHNSVIVKIIHNSEDLNFNCSDREILYTLQEYLGNFWKFKESYWGKSLYCNFKFVDPNPDLKSIFPVYKKFYMERMKLIFEQYDLRFRNDDKNPYFTLEKPIFESTILVYSKFESEYLKLKNEVINLKNQISQKTLKLLISKLEFLNQDIHLIIFDFAKESFYTYYEIRNNIEILRNRIKESLLDI